MADPRAESIRRTPPHPLVQLARAHALRRTETHILFHAFLTSQNLPKTAKALVKELSARTAGLGTEVEDESAKCTGNEMLALVKAKLDMAKEK